MRLTALALLILLPPQESDTVKNPYFSKCEWRLWAVDPAPVSDANVAIPPDLKSRATIQPAAADRRLYPVDTPPAGKFLAFSNSPSKKYAGMADDVYASWSGDHGWVRDAWKGPGGHEVAGVRGSILQFIDGDKAVNIHKLGINFFHQSTTGMGHTIANAVQKSQSEAYEKIYFSSGLITGPAHVSFTEENATFLERTNDLYLAYMPTYFNSLGSSDSETMAITKMIIAGAFLNPELKLKIKKNGLYASAMLHLWKASLPIDAPYDTELHHRIATKSVGNRFTVPGGYGAAGIERGDMCLVWHQYDDVEHLRRMVEMAKGLTAAPPEAILKIVEHKGGREHYVFKKTATYIQEKGDVVDLLVSAADSIDLAGRPLTFRWRTLILVANNGLTDGNPAAINVWRHKSTTMPDTGGGYTDYKYDATFANRRPIIVGLQDAVVKPGETVRIPIRAIDPEGFPVTLSKRSGEPGSFDGTDFVWECPRGEIGDKTVTVMASDTTSGNSYEAQQITLHIGPRILARMKADKVAGAAPLKVKFTAEGSVDAGGKGLTLEWGFTPRAPGYPKMPKGESAAPALEKIFDKPGIYEAWLKAKGPSGEDTAMMTILVTETLPAGRSGIALEGNGVEIPEGRATGSDFDHSNFGSVNGGASAEREFRVVNLSATAAKIAVKLASPEFKIVEAPRDDLDGFASTKLRIRFSPKGPGIRTAAVDVAGRKFTLTGTGVVDQAVVDREAAPKWSAAKSLAGSKQYAKAIEAIRAFLDGYPSATAAKEARELLAKLESDPAVKAEIEKQDAAAKANAARAAQDKEAVRLWSLAANYENSGLMDKAKAYWREIVEKFPESQYAAKAKEKLK